MTTRNRPAREITLERACSRVSLSCEEPLRGTASTVRHWLLVEQPGAWGRNALLNSDMPPEVATALGAAAAAADVRVVLIRRPGRARPAASRSAYIVHTGPDQVWQRRITFTSPGELLDLDLETEMHDSTGASLQPIYLVCTNGKHDLCCAVAGVPLARALAGLGDVWECSHVGGDRFAANLVCLPHGFYYGRVTPDVGLRILERYARGELLLSHLRGRASHEFAAQAADVFIRQANALHRVDDLTLESVAAGVPLRCLFAGRDGTPYRVTVEVTPAAVRRRLTCSGDSVAPPTYRVRWDRA